ncbi:hypothetical protein [Selenomonas sp. ND2010]|uniref:hypothetical protein n=1 Tax=Selenomonas sp. ND2010 TaxID=1410618 RepID=UPI00051AC885|nr:hypothetical protein [Selenomonas sp. ND2010]
MISKRKATAMILGLTMGISGTAMAAPNDDTDINARIAALEAQQQKLSKQLNALKKENAKLKRTEKVANSNKAAIKNLKDAQNRIQINGFGRVAWDNDNINDYANRNDFRRSYLDLEGKYKVNDRWNVNFQAETAQRYAKYVTADKNSALYHPKDADHKYDNEHGTIQRVWAEGSIGKLNVDVGRRWRFLGYNFAFFGNECDGVMLSSAIPKSNLTAKAFYLTPTDRGYHFSFGGVGLEGRVGHGLEMRVAYGKPNVDRNEVLGDNYYDVSTTKDADHTLPAGKDSAGKDLYAAERPNTIGSQAFLIGAMWNPMKNIFFLGDYVHTNRERRNYKGMRFDGRDTYAIQLNYRWPDLNSPGSFQLYSRYFNYPKNENDLVGVFGDKQDGAFHSGNRGWVFGFKYVPAKNIEWDTFYMKANATKMVWGAGRGEAYHHNMLRTRVDFHF